MDKNEEMTAQEVLKKLAPLLCEINRRAEKECADDGNDFTVTSERLGTEN